MRSVMTIGLLGGLALARTASPQVECTTTRENVRTWPVTVGGRLYEAHPSTPSYEGTTGLFHLPTAYTLPRGKISVSLFRDNLDRDPKDEDLSINGVTFAVGATDRIELFGSYGLQNRLDADALSQPGFVNDYPFVATPWQTGFGDVKLGLKLKLLDDYTGGPVGLALRGFVKLGTADQEKGLGTGKTSVGADLLVSKSLGRVMDLHGGIGYQVNSDPEKPRPVNLGNALKWGVGLNIPACRIVQIQAEVTGTSYSGGDFPQTNPVDLLVGPVFWFKGLFIRPALGKNLAFDDRGLNSSARSSMGWQVSIGYHPGTACCAIAAAAPPPRPAPAPQSNRPPAVSCEAERSVVTPGDTVGLRALASDPDGDALSYAWTCGSGRITGSGPKARLDTSGLVPTGSINATVRVSDGRGASAEATCPIRLAAVQRPVETVSCDSAGFPLNLARLNNVDKACLDDIASRLRQDPRSRVLVVGHADAAELRVAVVARQRAEAARDYLVGERGIAPSRVSVRSADATRPRGISRANRRVEVVFVPDGAVAPE